MGKNHYEGINFSEAGESAFNWAIEKAQDLMQPSEESKSTFELIADDLKKPFVAIGKCLAWTFGIIKKCIVWPFKKIFLKRRN